MKQRQSSALATILATIFLALFIALAFVASPLIALLAGMAVGWLLEYVTGDYVVQAFNAIGLTGVKGGDLPKVFGLIALVAWVLRLSMKDSSDFKRKGDE